ncbi:MAG: L,D-transpeptidase [Chitinivibrionia bacterium]|nr:L,D-transpeptidase [Chitinivibrionia bacterium]
MKNKNLITISYDDFSLVLVKDGEKFIFPVSCAKNGRGEKENSYKTPRGMFEIYKKIGKNAETGTVFESRKKTGDVYKNGLVCKENAILSRILWLNGLETHNKNTKNRYVYIHGTDRENAVGKVHFSHGCVVMKNADVLKLFDLVKAGDYVFIY